MLVLSRQIGQSIRIGQNITVTVLNCRGNHIRIGVSAPKDVPVHREEVHLRTQNPGLGAFRQDHNNPDPPTITAPASHRGL